MREAFYPMRRICRLQYLIPGTVGCFPQIAVPSPETVGCFPRIAVRSPETVEKFPGHYAYSGQPSPCSMRRVTEPFPVNNLAGGVADLGVA